MTDKKTLFSNWRQLYIVLLLALLAQIIFYFWVTKQYS